MESIEERKLTSCDNRALYWARLLWLPSLREHASKTTQKLLTLKSSKNINQIVSFTSEYQFFIIIFFFFFLFFFFFFFFFKKKKATTASKPEEELPSEDCDAKRSNTL
jgi:predicted PurR-regulated permease PerM